jgi:hypothetical protein
MEDERVFMQNLIYEIINYYGIKHLPKMRKDRKWLIEQIMKLKNDYDEAEQFHEQVFAEEREKSEIVCAQTTCESEELFHDIITCPKSHTPIQIKNYYDRINSVKKKIWPTVFPGAKPPPSK